MLDKTSFEKEQLLLDRLRQGDGSSSEEWFNQYYSILLKFVLFKIPDQADAEEIVQQTFINCLKHLSLFNHKSSILTWMQSIARHEIADYWRKKYAKKAIATIPLLDSFICEPLNDASQVAYKVGLVLDKMRHDYRELLLLKYVDGKQVKVIARELKRSFKSVEADLFRARKSFKELYVQI